MSSGCFVNYENDDTLDIVPSLEGGPDLLNPPAELAVLSLGSLGASPAVKVGDIDSSNARRIEDKGASYNGDCSDTTTAGNNVTLVDGNVYCASVETLDGEFIYLRGKWNGDTWVDTQVLTTLPLSTASVPALPLFGLAGLGALLGLAGYRRLKT